MGLKGVSKRKLPKAKLKPLATTNRGESSLRFGQVRKRLEAGAREVQRSAVWQRWDELLVRIEEKPKKALKLSTSGDPSQYLVGGNDHIELFPPTFVVTIFLKQVQLLLSPPGCSIVLIPLILFLHLWDLPQVA